MTILQSKHSEPPAFIIIIGFALMVGIPAFLVGFFGPLFLSESNLGPLLGIFVTGPVGTLAGAAWGIARSARTETPNKMQMILGCLGALWLLALLYTLFLIGLATHAAWPGLVGQALVLTSAGVTLYRGDVHDRLSSGLCRLRPLFITSAALVLVLTVFPPVTRPWWGSALTPGTLEATTRLPVVAFIGDHRFASSRQVPLFAVSRPMLALEWLCVTVGTFGVGHFITTYRRRHLSNDGGSGLA